MKGEMLGVIFITSLNCFLIQALNSEFDVIVFSECQFRFCFRFCSVGLTTSLTSGLWIGLNSLSFNSGWQWSDGGPFRYLNWLPGRVELVCGWIHLNLICLDATETFIISHVDLKEKNQEISPNTVHFPPCFEIYKLDLNILNCRVIPAYRDKRFVWQNYHTNQYRFLLK